MSDLIEDPTRSGPRRRPRSACAPRSSRALAQLKPRPSASSLRYGLDGSGGRTLEQVGVELGITRDGCASFQTRARELRHAAPGLELYLRVEPAEAGGPLSPGRLASPAGGEPPQRVQLDLPDALTGQPQPAADLLERSRLVPVDPVAERRLRARAREARECVPQRLGGWTSTASSGRGSSPATKSPRTASSSSPTGASRSSTAAARTSSTCCGVSDASSAISSSVGSRPSCVQSDRSALLIFCIRSTMCTGMRIVRALSASARATACSIHQVAYVENLSRGASRTSPRRGSGRACPPG